MSKVIIGAAAGLLALTGCTVTRSAESPAPAEAREAPTAQSSGFEYCGISRPGWSSSTPLSTLEPSSYGTGSDYCQSFRFGVGYVEDNPGVCTEFWNTDDYVIVESVMAPDGGSNNWDEAVGLVDAMWAAC